MLILQTTYHCNLHKILYFLTSERNFLTQSNMKKKQAVKSRQCLLRHPLVALILRTNAMIGDVYYFLSIAQNRIELQFNFITTNYKEIRQ